MSFDWRAQERTQNARQACHIVIGAHFDPQQVEWKLARFDTAPGIAAWSRTITAAFNTQPGDPFEICLHAREVLGFHIGPDGTALDAHQRTDELLAVCAGALGRGLLDLGRELTGSTR